MSIQRIIARITGKAIPSFSDARRYYRFFFPYALRYWPSYLIILIALLFSVATTLAYAWFLKGIMEAAVGHNFARISWMILFGIGFYVTNVLINFLNTYISNMTMNKVKRDVKSHLLSHLIRLPNDFFNRHQSGDLMSRLTNDSEIAVGAIGTNLVNTIRLPVTAAAAFFYLFSMNKGLSLILLSFGPIALISASIFSKYLRINGRKIQDQTGKISGLVNELLAGHAVIRSFNLEGMFDKRYRQEMETFLGLQTTIVKLSGGFRIGAQVASAAALLFCVGTGAFDVAKGEMSAGALLAFISLMQHLVSPFTGMARQFGGLQRSMAAAERLWEVLDVPAEQVVVLEQQPRLRNASLKLSDVSFSYDGKRNAVNNLSLTIPSGHVVAFVGPSGAGKSTLFNLLLRFYQPSKGTILFNTQPYALMEVGVLRQNIAYVPQETYLFSGTIRENILYGRSGATHQEVMQAAIDANIHDFVMSLPDGYETEVGERGIRLSGGQKQRIAIARAILKDAPVLLLDEATSALDSESELLVKEALARLMRNRTTLIIAHRLSTIQNADLIVVMNEGEIVETGSHRELLAKAGLYSRLHDLQFMEEPGQSSVSPMRPVAIASSLHSL